MNDPAYGIMATTELAPAEAEVRVRETLAAEGFGILSEIDVAATLKAKIDVDRAPYKILGACNPGLANRALQAEETIGLLLPCNVVVYASGGRTVVGAMEPTIMSQLSTSAELQAIADEAREKIVRAIEKATA